MYDASVGNSCIGFAEWMPLLEAQALHSKDNRHRILCEVGVPQEVI
jgi:hypothetical protein